MQLGALHLIRGLKQHLGGGGVEILYNIRRYRHLHGSHVLSKVHDLPLRRAWNAFHLLTVVEGDGVSQTVRCHRVLGSVSDGNRYAVAVIPLNEDIPQRAVRVHFLGVYDGATATERPKFP